MKTNIQNLPPRKNGVTIATYLMLGASTVAFAPDMGLRQASPLAPRPQADAGVRLASGDGATAVPLQSAQCCCRLNGAVACGGLGQSYQQASVSDCAQVGFGCCDAGYCR